jgi:drug/metabolite transporter (DMT)-like permease
MNFALRGNALLGLAAATLWGGGDFSGGMGVKQAGGGLGAALRVVLLSHAVSFTVMVTITRVRGDAFPHGALLAWGIAAGVAGGLALTCFYIALSRGGMGASAALSGLLAAGIPAALTMWREGSPGDRPLIGFAVAALAIWLIAGGAAKDLDGVEAGPSSARETMLLAMLAGVGFGVYFVALKMAGTGGVIWPMATARIGSIGVCALLFAGARMREGKNAEPRFRGGREVVGWVFATALLDTSGNLLFVQATRAGRLDVAAVVGSLYPASTILLAAFALGELPTRRQAWGMLTATVAVVLIAM